MKIEGLNIKTYPLGYPYIERGIVKSSGIGTEVIRYAKNYTKSNKRFSLCVITNQKDTKKIEGWLDTMSKKIKPKDIESKFKKLGVEYDGK